MSRKGAAFVVVALLIGATIPALLTTTQTKGYPASPHYGDAYIGEFWLEERNITLDTATSIIDNGITTFKLNMGDNEIIYTYGADTGDYRVDIDG